MASGPEHYREAERILAGEVSPANDPNRVVVADPDAVAAAQVHATLALAAATAQGMKAVMPFHDAHAWHAAAGTRLPTAREDSYGDEEATP